MSGFALQAGGYKNTNTSENISTYPCKLLGVFVAESSSGTIQLFDTSASAFTKPITGVIQATAGTWYNIPVSTSEGLYLGVSGTIDATVVFA